MKRLLGIDDHRFIALEPGAEGQVFILIGAEQPGIVVDGSELLRAVAAVVREAYAPGGES